jgi:hypothetical protein
MGISVTRPRSYIALKPIYPDRYIHLARLPEVKNGNFLWNKIVKDGNRYLPLFT